MTKTNGKRTELEFKFDVTTWGELTPRQITALNRGNDMEACAPLIAKLVVGCNVDIGALDDPDTYLDSISWDQMRVLFDQLGDAIKNV